MPKHQNWGGFAANVDVLQNRMDACAFRMHALSPTKERRDFSRGLLTEHRRLRQVGISRVPKGSIKYPVELAGCTMMGWRFN